MSRPIYDDEGYDEEGHYNPDEDWRDMDEWTLETELDNALVESFTQAIKTFCDSTSRTGNLRKEVIGYFKIAIHRITFPDVPEEPGKKVL